MTKHETEYAYTCTQCSHEEWSEEQPVLTGNDCPECGCPMAAAAERPRTRSHQYQIKRLPNGMIRVVDLEKGRVDGVWVQEDKQWFDIAGFIGQK